MPVFGSLNQDLQDGGVINTNEKNILLVTNGDGDTNSVSPLDFLLNFHTVL
jgi:hypothetical protein